MLPLHKSDKGFTVVEVILVIIIICLVAGFVYVLSSDKPVKDKETAPAPTTVEERQDTPTATPTVWMTPSPTPEPAAMQSVGTSFNVSDSAVAEAELISVDNSDTRFLVNYRIKCSNYSESCVSCSIYEWKDARMLDYNPAIHGYVKDEATNKEYFARSREDGSIYGDAPQESMSVCNFDNNKKNYKYLPLSLEFEPLPDTVKTVTIKLGDKIDPFVHVPVK